MLQLLFKPRILGMVSKINHTTLGGKIFSSFLDELDHLEHFSKI